MHKKYLNTIRCCLFNKDKEYKNKYIKGDKYVKQINWKYANDTY